MKVNKSHSRIPSAQQFAGKLAQGVSLFPSLGFAIPPGEIPRWFLIACRFAQTGAQITEKLGLK
jgi:hypothetical protein